MICELLPATLAECTRGWSGVVLTSPGCARAVCVIVAASAVAPYDIADPLWVTFIKQSCGLLNRVSFVLSTCYVDYGMRLYHHMRSSAPLSAKICRNRISSNPAPPYDLLFLWAHTRPLARPPAKVEHPRPDVTIPNESKHFNRPGDPPM